LSLLGPLFRWDDVQESFSDRASLQAEVFLEQGNQTGLEGLLV